MRVLRDIGILLTIFGLLWFAFSRLTKSSKLSDYSLISKANEEKLGDFMYEQQLKDAQFGKVVKNKEVQKAVDTIVNRLTNTLETKYNYRVSIINNDDVNAFTIPGGRIFVFTGLINKLDSSEYLAAVLAHEIGHNEKQHLVKRLATMFGLQLLLGGDQVVIGEVLKELGSLKYARSQETESDEFAFDLLEKSGIHPNNFAKVMSEFLKLEKDNFSGMEVLQTHPGSTERRRNTLEYEVAAGFKPNPLAVDWKSFRNAISKNASIAVEEPILDNELE